jgi:hypothetical protein
MKFLRSRLKDLLIPLVLETLSSEVFWQNTFVARISLGVHTSVLRLLRSWLKVWAPLVSAMVMRFTEGLEFCMKKKLRDEVYSIAT